MTPRAARQAAATAVTVLVVLLGFAAPSAADAPRPTDYRSTVTDVSPALPAGATIRVIGGDSLLELSVPEGHTAEVADYATSEDADVVPYLRFDADGTVRRNALAIATTANEARYGTSSTVPDPDAEPRWETVATNGAYAWHDHRIHWMSPKAPRVVAEDGRVDLGGANGTWSVPIEVDGTATVVTGELELLSPPPVIAWVVLLVVAAVAAVVVGVRFGLRGASAVGTVAAVGAVVAATATWRAVPADAGASAVPVVVAFVALAAGLTGVPSPRSHPPRGRRRICRGAPRLGPAPLDGPRPSRAADDPRAVARPDGDRGRHRGRTRVGRAPREGPRSSARSLVGPLTRRHSQPDRLNRRHSSATTTSIDPTATG